MTWDLNGTVRRLMLIATKQERVLGRVSVSVLYYFLGHDV